MLPDRVGSRTRTFVELSTSVKIWARAHHQLVTRSGWQDAGSNARAFDRAIERGLLTKVAPNVAVLAGSPTTPLTRIAGWSLSIGPGTMVSHRSAAFVWGAAVSGDAPVDLIGPGKSSRRPTSEVRVHCPRDARSLHAIARRGILVTSPLRTLVDLGAVRPDQVATALEGFLVAGLVSIAGVERNANRDRRRGRAGSAALLTAIDELLIDGQTRDSQLESRGAAAFDRHGLDGWVFHHRIGPYEVDFAFPGARVAIEVDGWATHGSRAAFEADRERDAWLAGHGWIVLRFTWRQVTIRADTMANRVRATLEHRAAAA